MGKRGLQYVITDSWEAGVANWTDEMIAEFTKRRGYDMRPWLPVLTGRVVESAEASDRFLWDFRKTIGDLTAENHYDQLTDILHERGMGRYTESHESGRAFIGDGMEVKRNADIPMSAMWLERPGQASRAIRRRHPRVRLRRPHLRPEPGGGRIPDRYRNAWACSPETLKPTADRMLANGPEPLRHPHLGPPARRRQDPGPRPRALRPVVHPPRDLGGAGQALDDLSRPAARSCSSRASSWPTSSTIYGEDSNITALFGAKMPDIPAGYNFDYVNADALLNRLAVDGRTHHHDHRHELPRAGARSQQPAHVARRAAQDPRPGRAPAPSSSAPSPIDSPSLTDDQAEFHTIADQLWGPASGKGKVFGGQTIAQALAALGRRPTSNTPSRARTRASVRASHAGRRRALLGQQPQQSRGDPGGHLPRHRQGARALACRYRRRRAGFLPHRQRAHDRAAAPRARTTRCSWSSARRPPRRRAPCPSRSKRSWPRSTALGTSLSSPTAARRPRSPSTALGSWSDNADPGVKYFSGTAHLHQDHPGAGGLVQGRRQALARSRRRQEPRRGHGQRQAARHPLEDAVPRGRDRRAQAGRQHPGDQGDQPLGQPADRRPAARRREEVHLYGGQVLRADSPLLPSGLLGPVKIVRLE